MKRLAILGIPLGPLLRNLPDGCIRTARDVTDDPIVANSHIVSFLEVSVLEFREELSEVVGDDDVCSVEPVHLMSQHESSLRVSVVGDHDTTRDLSVRSL